MINISNVIKKVKQQEQTEESEARQIPPETAMPASQPEARSPIQISSIRISCTNIASCDDCAKLYNEMVSRMEETLKAKDLKSIDIGKVTPLIEKVYEQLALGNENMLMLAITLSSHNGDYLAFHSTNVGIYSLQVGIGLGYEKEKLIELGLSAFLHDLGMTAYMDLVNQPRKLTLAEQEKIKKHSAIGAEIVKNIEGMNRNIVDTVIQVHERLDGSGYPNGLDKDTINRYARIIGLMDVYEAMTQQRPYRDRYRPLDAIRQIIANKKLFEYDVMKVLIERIGLFPVGGVIELSTREIARVVKLNYTSCLRPVVEILYDVDGRELKEKDRKIIDLATHPTIYIKYDRSSDFKLKPSE